MWDLFSLNVSLRRIDRLWFVRVHTIPYLFLSLKCPFGCLVTRGVSPTDFCYSLSFFLMCEKAHGMVPYGTNHTVATSEKASSEFGGTAHFVFLPLRLPPTYKGNRRQTSNASIITIAFSPQSWGFHNGWGYKYLQWRTTSKDKIGKKLPSWNRILNSWKKRIASTKKK